MSDKHKDSECELEYYLWNLDADKEERRCARMWVRDGHWITENDHFLTRGDDEPWDFLSASREASSNCYEYTDSFYDVKTLEYIRKQNLNSYQLKKLREYRRSGGRFRDEWLGDMGFNNYVTFLREYKDTFISMFDGHYGRDIEKYGAEFLVRRNLTDAFIKFVTEKEAAEPKGPSFEDQPILDEKEQDFFGPAEIHQEAEDELPF